MVDGDGMWMYYSDKFSYDLLVMRGRAGRILKTQKGLCTWNVFQRPLEGSLPT